MKKYLLLTLVLMLALALALTACGAPVEEDVPTDTDTDAATDTDADAVATQEIQVGTSNVYFTAPADYQKGEMTQEDTEEGMVAYYFSENDLMDFDLYYWAKATDETLESAIAEETEGEVATVEFNGINFVSYNDTEDSVDGTFPTVTYIMEDGDYFVEFVFWLDGDDAEAKVNDIMNTVELREAEDTAAENQIRLGTSDLYITVDKAFTKGEMIREDTDLCMVAYYKSEETLLDFDVYYWAKGTDETLESTAALEQEEFQAEIVDREINGIATKYYNAEAEESVDGTFPTLTYIIDDGDYLAEIVFWLDGDNAAEEAEAIISTLAH